MGKALFGPSHLSHPSCILHRYWTPLQWLHQLQLCLARPWWGFFTERSNRRVVEISGCYKVIVQGTNKTQENGDVWDFGDNICNSKLSSTNMLEEINALKSSLHCNSDVICVVVFNPSLSISSFKPCECRHFLVISPAKSISSHLRATVRAAFFSSKKMFFFLNVS